MEPPVNRDERRVRAAGIRRSYRLKIFDVVLVASAEQAPHEIWQIKHVPRDGTVRLFYDKDEAERVMRRLNPDTWMLEGWGAHNRQLADADAACAAEKLVERKIHDSETGAYLVSAWGSADVLQRVEQAENGSTGGPSGEEESGREEHGQR
jgi:hypothetical protein